jgi:predicted alpha/beta hydrolase
MPLPDPAPAPSRDAGGALPYRPRRATPASRAPDLRVVGAGDGADPLDSDAAVEPLWLHAADGYRLGVTRYPVVGGPGAVRAHVVVAGAIGVPQRFYRRFAAFARARGHVVWTVDYRGVDRSAPVDGAGARASLRGFAATLLDWGRLDLAAVVAAAADLARHDGAPVWLVAHSFGGHALGLLPDPALVRACYTFGTGAGWHGWMAPAERARVLALWHVAGPVLTGALGYTPWRRMGMGEDLPRGVYRQWKRWCRYPDYWFGDPADGTAMRARFARVRAPIAAASATDDPWSPPRSRDAFMAGYANAAVTCVDLDPATSGTGPLGHLGYFRPAARVLWETALDWLAAHGTRTRPG